MVELTRHFVLELENNRDWVPAKDTFARHSSRTIIKFAFGDEFDPAWIHSKFNEINLMMPIWFLGATVFGISVWDCVPHYGSGYLKACQQMRQTIYDAIKRRRGEVIYCNNYK